MLSLHFVPFTLVSIGHSSAVYQAWGAGRSVVSGNDKKEVRKLFMITRVPTAHIRI